MGKRRTEGPPDAPLKVAAPNGLEAPGLEDGPGPASAGSKSTGGVQLRVGRSPAGNGPLIGPGGRSWLGVPSGHKAAAPPASEASRSPWFATQTRKGVLGNQSSPCPAPGRENRPEIHTDTASSSLSPPPHPAPCSCVPALLLLPEGSLGTCSGERHPLGGDRHCLARAERASVPVTAGPLSEACALRALSPKIRSGRSPPSLVCMSDIRPRDMRLGPG